MGTASSKKSRAYKQLDRKYLEAVELNIKKGEELHKQVQDTAQLKVKFNAVFKLLLMVLHDLGGGATISLATQQIVTPDVRMDRFDRASGEIVLSLVRPTVQPVPDDGTDTRPISQPNV